MAVRWLWVVLVVAGAASLSVTDEVGSTVRLLNADLDQDPMPELGREDIRLAVRKVKVAPVSRRHLADRQLEIDLGMANLEGDDLSPDLGEERRFDFEPGREEARNMDVQKILAYDKLLDETEANYLEATDSVIKRKLKWQTESIMKLLHAGCKRYIALMKPELWSPLKQKLRTAKYTVFVTCGKLLHPAKPKTNSTNSTNSTGAAKRQRAVVAANASMVAARALNQTDQIELAAKTLTSATKESAGSNEAAEAENAAVEAAKAKASAAAHAKAMKAAKEAAKKAKEAAHKKAYLDGTLEPPEFGKGRLAWIGKEKNEKRRAKEAQKAGPL